MKYYLYITGCDMNYSDAERIAAVFNEHGFSLAKSEEKADIIIAVACSVREKAVHKIYGKINQWRKSQISNLKSQDIPNKLQAKKLKAILVTGCVLSHDKKKLEEKVDLVFGIDEVEKLKVS